MFQRLSLRLALKGVAAACLAATVVACNGLGELPPTAPIKESEVLDTRYRIGVGDGLTIFVWRNPELSTGVTVRPDGRLTIPLIEDLPAVGKTPTELARDIEKELATYIQDPIVSVIVGGGAGPFADQIRVVGEATRPQALPYRATMTLLDVMVAVGGLSDFAAGNRATITRYIDGTPKQYRVRLDDLIKDGDMTANVRILPGDIIAIPEAWF
ncbi:MAG: XrtA/PEP-CTERM system exopolysaccharide export protein [Rhodospirillales bacterium]